MQITIMNDPRRIDYEADPETRERKRYENVYQCPDCLEYYDATTGEVMPEPLWAECEMRVCMGCVELGSE